MELSGSATNEREQLLDEGGLNSRVGARLITLRKERGLSQRELARRAEITNSTLSMIEQGKVSPSISSLEKILSAFPISFQAFFSDSIKPHHDVYKPEELTRLDIGGAEIAMLAMSDSAVNGCYLGHYRLESGQRGTFDWLKRGGVVAAFLVDGNAHLSIDGCDYMLNSGDSLHFNVDRAHSVHNPGSISCVFIVSTLPE